MQSKLMEEGKDPSSNFRSAQTRPMPLKGVQIFLVFLVVGLGLLIISMYAMKFFSVHVFVPVAPSTFRSCFEETNSLQAWVRPPSNLLHTMNDSELLWRASFAPRRKEYPFNRVPKIAFMFLAKGPLPLAPLWERFFKGHKGLYSIYIHSHPSYVPNFTASSVFYGRQIPSLVARWGEMSMCEAERRLLANALFDISNEWFVLLSEACIPLRNFSTVYQYIARSHHSFMGSYDEDGPYGRGRYDGNMEPVVTLAQWRKGSQWFEVSREVAVRIVEDTIYYPKFRDFCRPPCYVDEHYFPTMLTIHVPHLLANRTLTWTDWSRGGAHPATFGNDDINDQFFENMFESQSCIYNEQPTKICYLFARKFAPSALGPLLQLAAKVFEF